MKGERDRSGTHDDWRRLLGAAGVAGPVLFTLAWLAGWAAQHDYSPRHEDISALAALDAQRAWIMMTGFIALGTCVAALASGLFGAIRGGHSTSAGPAILLVIGLGIAASGLMRNDCSTELAACHERVRAGDVSWHHNGHDLASISVFVLFIVVQLVFAHAFRRDERWTRLHRYSLVSAVLTLALLMLYGAEVFGDSNGLVQRIFVAVPLLWVAVVGIRLTHSAARGAATRQSEQH